MDIVTARTRTVVAGMHREPEVAELDDGSVALFSCRAPDKDTTNEDACAYISVDPETLVLAVADGVGGYPDGDVAARIAIELLAKEIRAGASLPFRAAVVNGFESAHAAIVTELGGAATTLIAVEISGGFARTYNVGDSGVCIIGGRGRIKLQTVAHSPTGYAVQSGLLTEAQALRHDERHLVSNLLGMENMFIEIGAPFPLAPRDTLIVASDGLYDNLTAAEIAGFACRGPLGTAAATLIDAASARMRYEDEQLPGKADDLTVLMYRGAGRRS